jgi:hypothetical protein
MKEERVNYPFLKRSGSIETTINMLQLMELFEAYPISEEKRVP